MSRTQVTTLALAVACLTISCVLFGRIGQSVSTSDTSCDASLWKHVYNPQRLHSQGCATVTGVKQDATHGKLKDGCRREADGDFHCWLKLDVRQSDGNNPLHFLNDKNLKEQSGNLVFEPMCQHAPKQADTIKSGVCRGWTQTLIDASVGAHLRITGTWVLDSQHGHMEIHPVTSIEVIP